MNNKHTVPTIKIVDILENSYPMIDVRSPSEFQEFHIPGAVNIPIFSDEERAEVGTLYKQKGREYARDRGIEILGSKLSTLYNQVKQLHEQYADQSMVVYCWRGGMRSKSIASVMGMMDVPIFQLEGGIRSYRQLIMEELEVPSHMEKRYIVLEGLTGTNKTDILTILEDEQYPVINLERLVNHRGSIFGHIGLEPRSQKEFESLLYHRLHELRDSPFYIIEAESKRIGAVVLPDFLLKGKEKGVRIHIEMELEKRAQNICDAYRFDLHFDQFQEAILHLKKRLHQDLFEQISDLLQKKDIYQIVLLLLKEYYDPRYDYTSQQYETDIHTVFIDSVRDGVQKVKDVLKTISNEFLYV
ncbi:tRNA 2-selenouridine(34) synthase MnmH [Bacillus suaedaesalsae]|uniref:tRNA 2-selenouridine(34) synthase MnmH n=1 Tax=Bacillus suaedaesalsae TaxID=2810349 RepID=A0ABS2DIV3_9BACI|nr:tRNA 2-selenouridine(34) synthase MnmH [Bacillus suaedaesalsae]MBM6618342.1 tRNA 2-selenouridine(34) synthase MnmH [Bacillus suaedaesalsae]